MLEVLTSKGSHAICSACKKAIPEDEDRPMSMIYIPFALTTEHTGVAALKVAYLISPSLENMYYICPDCCETVPELKFLSSGQMTICTISWYKAHTKILNGVEWSDIVKKMKEVTGKLLMEQTRIAAAQGGYPVIP